MNKTYTMILTGFMIAVMVKTFEQTGYHADAVYIDGEFKGLQINRD